MFVLASLQEGLSIALIESMALGTPVVVTNAGGNPEVVEDGVHGYVVEPRDAAALADRIITLLSDPELRVRMGLASRARAREFDIRGSVRRMEELYREAAA